MLDDFRCQGHHASRVFISSPFHHPSQETLPVLLNAMPSGSPKLVVWSDEPLWTPTMLAQLTAWIEGCSKSTEVVTIVTSWATWRGDFHEWARIAERYLRVPARWLWAVSRPEWNTARSPINWVTGGNFLQAESLSTDFEGWLDSR